MTLKKGRCASADKAVAAFLEAAVEAQAKQAKEIAELRDKLDAAQYVIDLQAAQIAQLEAARCVIDVQVQVLRVS